MTQQFYFLGIYTKEMKTGIQKQIQVQASSKQHYSQQPKGGNTNRL